MIVLYFSETYVLKSAANLFIFGTVFFIIIIVFCFCFLLLFFFFFFFFLLLFFFFRFFFFFFVFFFFFFFFSVCFFFFFCFFSKLPLCDTLHACSLSHKSNVEKKMYLRWKILTNHAFCLGIIRKILGNAKCPLTQSCGNTMPDFSNLYHFPEDK